MYRGYNLDLSTSEKQAFLGVEGYEIVAYENRMTHLKNGLQKKIDETIHLPRTSDNRVDGTKLINDWFPDYQADVFISHSHNDVRTAKRLACWLEKEFGLTTFIDSTVWGNANDLLEKIDKKYCVLKREKDGSIASYNYQIRNFTTSHIHMMLSTALNDVIHSTECIIFMNTPESLKINEVENKKTVSPWIYSELKTASIVERIYPREKSIQESIEKRYLQHNYSQRNKLEVEYDVKKQLAIFENLDADKLQLWQSKFTTRKNHEHPLDILYAEI
jgi:hypothetical protein